MNKVKISFLLVICSILSFQLYAQEGINVQNLSTLNVDQLTDDQIQKFIDQMESSGYSQQQLEILAKSRGMSSSQIMKLRQRMERLKSSSKKGKEGSVESETRLRNKPDFVEESETEFDPFANLFPIDSLEENLPIFGRSFFENIDLKLEAPTNIPTPVNYVIGAGDEIIIDIWGASEQTYQLSVSPEGSILIPSLGPVYLSGLSIEKADQRIRGKLKSIYSSLGDNTFAQISLGQIRTIQINVIGEVARPGSFPLSSFATPINALYASGGPSETGSFREIHIFRGGTKVANFDLYDFLVYGRDQSVKLQDQDVILVKPYSSRIRLDGEVKRPAYYELLPTETFANLMEFSGGFNERAYKKSISLQRNLNNSKSVITIQEPAFSNTVLQNGDRIEVGKVSDRFTNRVRIEGALNHPGEFQLSDGMTLADLVDLADGIRGDAFMGQGIIIRSNQDFTLKSIPFRTEDLKSEGGAIQLENEDLVKITSIFDLQEEMSIVIDGEVNKPGQFPFASEMTVENLIYLAGGFKESAARSFVEVARRVSKNNGNGDQSISAKIFNFPISRTLTLDETASAFQLEPFDLVVIRKSPFYEEQVLVEIEGEVQYPGKYVLERKDERISDLLRRAGNLTELAYVRGATLIRRTEYYISEEDKAADEGVENNNLDKTNRASEVRRSELQELFERDTLVQGGQEAFKTEESIGIRLDKIIENPGSKMDLILKEGDVLSIPRELQTVRVRGEVLYPSTIPYLGPSLRGFVSGAGGFSERAKRNKSYVVYPNGSAKKTLAFLWIRDYPSVLPGSEIIVPQKPQRRQITPPEIIGMATSIASIAVIVNSLVSQNK